jgi:predicted thioredoxin/glutaredoxin
LFSCKLADQVEAKEEFHQDEKEVKSVASSFVRELYWIYSDDNRKNQCKEYGENHESNKLRKSLIYITFVSEVKPKHLNGKPENEQNHTKHRENI